jgi:hypothetical protein
MMQVHFAIDTYLSNLYIFNVHTTNCDSRIPLAAFGHHLSCGSYTGRYRSSDRNDLVVTEPEKILRHAGLLTIREEKGVFYSINDGENKHNRPDISILNPIIAGSSKDLIDVAITAPIPGSDIPSLFSLIIETLQKSLEDNPTQFNSRKNCLIHFP